MINEKQHFTQQMFDYLHEINFVVLKHLDEKVDVNSNADVDLLLESNEVEPILGFIRNHPAVEKMLTRYRKSMVQVFIHFLDGSFLQLDLLFKLVRVQYEYMVTMEVFGNKKKVEEESKPTRRSDSSSM